MARAADAARLEQVSQLLAHWSGVSEIVGDCVPRNPRLWRRGLRLALAAEAGIVGKLRATVLVARARFGGRELPPMVLPDASPGS